LNRENVDDQEEGGSGSENKGTVVTPGENINNNERNIIQAMA
jgi:hypothetical protein